MTTAQIQQIMDYTDPDYQKHILEIVNQQQNRTNTFVNVSKEDLIRLSKRAWKEDMSYNQIVEMIIDLNYA